MLEVFLIMKIYTVVVLLQHIVFYALKMEAAAPRRI
jgi:hypothetical protein